MGEQLITKSMLGEKLGEAVDNVVVLQALAVNAFRVSYSKNGARFEAHVSVDVNDPTRILAITEHLIEEG